jgi:hypothetical protein
MEDRTRHPVVIEMGNVRAVGLSEGRDGGVMVETATVTEVHQGLLSKKPMEKGKEVTIKQPVDRVLDLTGTTHMGLVDATEFMKRVNGELRLTPEGSLQVIEDKNNAIAVITQKPKI